MCQDVAIENKSLRQFNHPNKKLQKEKWLKKKRKNKVKVNQNEIRYITLHFGVDLIAESLLCSSPPQPLSNKNDETWRIDRWLAFFSDWGFCHSHAGLKLLTGPLNHRSIRFEESDRLYPPLPLNDSLLNLALHHFSISFSFNWINFFLVFFSSKKWILIFAPENWMDGEFVIIRKCYKCKKATQ